jgi:hypothetical protein
MTMERIRCEVIEKEIKIDLCLYEKGQITDIKPACLKCTLYKELQKLNFDAIKGFPPTILQGFTRYPPLNEDIPIEELAKKQAYVTQWDIDDKTFMHLSLKETEFNNSQDPIYALRAFLISNEARLYPPMWVMDWLIRGFKEYHKSFGKKSLEKLLGFRKGKGQSIAWKKELENGRDQMLMLDVFRLHKFGGYSINEASKMVAERLSNTIGWDKTGYKLRTLKAGIIETRYYEKWKNLFDKYSNDLLKTMSKAFLKDRKYYLKTFGKPKGKR